MIRWYSESEQLLAINQKQTGVEIASRSWNGGDSSITWDAAPTLSANQSLAKDVHQQENAGKMEFFSNCDRWNSNIIKMLVVFREQS